MPRPKAKITQVLQKTTKKVVERRYPNGKTQSEIETCVHRGKQVGVYKASCKCNNQPIYECSVHGKCTLKQARPDQQEKVCIRCMQCQLKSEIKDESVEPAQGSDPLHQGEPQVPEQGKDGVV